MKLGKIFVLTGAFLVMTNSANAKLPGYTEGAEIMRPKIENGQIDSMSGIILFANQGAEKQQSSSYDGDDSSRRQSKTRNYLFPRRGIHFRRP